MAGSVHAVHSEIEAGWLGSWMWRMWLAGHGQCDARAWGSWAANQFRLNPMLFSDPCILTARGGCLQALRAVGRAPSPRAGDLDSVACEVARDSARVCPPSIGKTPYHL